MAPRRIRVAEGAPRLDRALAEALPELSRSRLQQLIREGRVTVDGAVTRDPAVRAPAGAEVALDLPPPAPADPQAEAIPLDVVFEDGDLIVIDKPPGLVTHPAPGHPAGTLVNALLAHCGASLSGVGGVLRPGIVHRLDRDTSGLMVAAKTDLAHRGLSAQLADHGRTGPLERSYLALVWGVPSPRIGVVDAPLERSLARRDRVAAARPGRGRFAVTRYAVMEVFADAAGEPAASALRCDLETGRTHQIRAHMAHIGHPLLGDPVYGAGYKTKGGRLSPPAQAALRDLGRQALHAGVLGFAHPRSGAHLRFARQPPADLDRLIAALRETPLRRSATQARE